MGVWSCVPLAQRAIRWWKVFTGETLAPLEGHSDGVNSAALSPDGDIIASGAGDMSIRLCKSSTGALLNSLQGNTCSVTSVAFLPDGRCKICLSLQPLAGISWGA